MLDPMLVVLDHAALENIPGLEGGASSPLLARLISLYETEGRRQIDLMNAAVGNGSAADLQQSAHRLKSSCGTLGLLRIAALAKHMEEAGRAGRVPVDDALMQQIESEYQLALKALNQLRQTN